MTDVATPSPAPGTSAFTMANMVTVLRLCAVPVTVWLVLDGQFLAAFWLFAAAGASDALDGWLARRRGPTRLGAMLDPLADKALLVAMFVTLAAAGLLPGWLLLLVVLREAAILGGAAALTLRARTRGGQPVSIRPIPVSKANTAIQITTVAATLLMEALRLDWPMLGTALRWATVAGAIASLGAYACAMAARR